MKQKHKYFYKNINLKNNTIKNIKSRYFIES